MLHSEIQLLSEFTNAQYIAFRAVVLNNILATDMARHGEYTTKLKRLTDPNTPPDDRKMDKQFEMEIIIKCADTSNVWPSAVCGPLVFIQDVPGVEAV